MGEDTPTDKPQENKKRAVQYEKCLFSTPFKPNI